MAKQSKRQLFLVASFIIAGCLMLVMGLSVWQTMAMSFVRTIGNNNDDRTVSHSVNVASRTCSAGETWSSPFANNVNLGQRVDKLLVCTVNTWWHDCLTFGNITLNNADTVSSSYVTLRSQVNASGATAYDIHLLDSDDVSSGTLACDPSDVTNMTTNASFWTFSSWSVNTNYNTNDFNGALTEVITRPGWKSAGGIQVMLVNAENVAKPATVAYKAEDYAAGLTSPAKLTVIYTTPGIPEFNTWTLALTLLASAVGILVVRRYILAPRVVKE